MSRVEAWLDDTPGETRGVIARDGRFTHILIDGDDDVAAHRLGARAIGRVTEVAAGLKGVFVDLGAEGPVGFLPTRAARLAVGEKIEVEVAAEPRESKGPTLRLIGAGHGAPRLLAAGPTVLEALAELAPGREPVRGVEAIRAVTEAEEEALSDRLLFKDAGLDLAVQRTRALIAVDLDLAGDAASGARDRANRRGLAEAARLIGLKRWGGLVVVDMIGGGQDGARMLEAARAAFPGPQTVLGPVSRLGLLQLSLPWRRTPVEEALNGPAGERLTRRRAIDGVRALRLALLSDTASPRRVLVCAPAQAAIAGPLVQRLGPRADLRADAARPAGAYVVGEG